MTSMACTTWCGGWARSLFSTELWPPRESGPESAWRAKAMAVPEAVVHRLVEYAIVIGKALVDQQLHARHVIVLECSLHSAGREGPMAAQAEPLFLVPGHPRAQARRLGQQKGRG